MTKLRKLITSTTLALFASLTLASAQVPSPRLPPPPGIPGITAPPAPLPPNFITYSYSGPPIFWVMASSIPGLSPQQQCALALQLWLQFVLQLGWHA